MDGRQFKVFLSYASHDKRFARRLASDLERVHIDVWLDELDLDVGESLNTISDAILKSDFLVVIVSNSSMSSPWVAREVDMAINGDVGLIPALIETVPEGSWPAQLSGASHADFRRAEEYRRSFQRLVDRVLGSDGAAVYLTAKEAIKIVRANATLTGELCGVSQQGVAILYSLINSRDWELADTMAGSSRMWIVEFYNEESYEIQTFSVVDGVVHELGVMYPLHSIPVASDEMSMVMYSTAFNHLPQGRLGQPPPHMRWNLGVGELQNATDASLQSEQSTADLTSPDEIISSEPLQLADITSRTKRFTRYQPVPIFQRFIDSDDAVSAAIASARQQGIIIDKSDDLLVLTRLESDKRNRGLLTWTVAFFDPALTESVRAVGVNAIDGTIRNTSMQTEILNADYISMHVSDSGRQTTFNMVNQFRAVENHVWDIPEKPVAHDGLRLNDAISMVGEFLTARGEQNQWQFSIVSNTGFYETVFADSLRHRGDALIGYDGYAGQWVIEVFSMRFKFKRFGMVFKFRRARQREGYEYEWMQIACTRADGPIEMNRRRITVEFPLSDSTLPRDIVGGYEAARRLAIHSLGQDYELMSVQLLRRRGGAAWYFRFYDSSEIVAQRLLSGDGMRVEDYHHPLHPASHNP
jgi:hypothetical protein